MSKLISFLAILLAIALTSAANEVSHRNAKISVDHELEPEMPKENQDVENACPDTAYVLSALKSYANEISIELPADVQLKTCRLYKLSSDLSFYGVVLASGDKSCSIDVATEPTNEHFVAKVTENSALHASLMRCQVLLEGIENNLGLIGLDAKDMSSTASRKRSWEEHDDEDEEEELLFRDYKKIKSEKPVAKEAPVEDTKITAPVEEDEVFAPVEEVKPSVPTMTTENHMNITCDNKYEVASLFIAKAYQVGVKLPMNLSIGACKTEKDNAATAYTVTLKSQGKSCDAKLRIKLDLSEDFPSETAKSKFVADIKKCQNLFDFSHCNNEEQYFKHFVAYYKSQDAADAKREFKLLGCIPSKEDSRGGLLQVKVNNTDCNIKVESRKYVNNIIMTKSQQTAMEETTKECIEKIKSAKRAKNNKKNQKKAQKLTSLDDLELPKLEKHNANPRTKTHQDNFSDFMDVEDLSDPEITRLKKQNGNSRSKRTQDNMDDFMDVQENDNLDDMELPKLEKHDAHIRDHSGNATYTKPGLSSFRFNAGDLEDDSEDSDDDLDLEPLELKRQDAHIWDRDGSIIETKPVINYRALDSDFDNFEMSKRVKEPENFTEAVNNLNSQELGSPAEINHNKKALDIFAQLTFRRILMGQLVTLQNVKKVTAQVVAGLKYNITLEFNKETCQLQVWRRPGAKVYTVMHAKAIKNSNGSFAAASESAFQEKNCFDLFGTPMGHMMLEQGQ